jgi:hypothetical protein
VNLVAGAGTGTGTGDMVGRRQSLLLKNHHIFKKQGEDPHAGVSAKHNVCEKPSGPVIDVVRFEFESGIVLFFFYP